jgi:hypothetical protein
MPSTPKYGRQRISYSQPQIVVAVYADHDIVAERQKTLESLFKDSVNVDKLKMSDEEKEQFRRKQYESLLAQILLGQRISVPEFELGVQSSAYLRKIAEMQTKDVGAYLNSLNPEGAQSAYKSFKRYAKFLWGSARSNPDALLRLQDFLRYCPPRRGTDKE